MSRDLSVLQQWAQYGRDYAPLRRSKPDWAAVTRLIEASKPYLLEQAVELRRLLTEWSGRFEMGDPFLNDLGLHRWIEKETSYSDWLAWVLEQLEPSAVLYVLGISESAFPVTGATKCSVQRESPLDQRFIDLLVQFDGLPDDAIGVEVKTDDEQYAKQNDYFASLKKRFGKDVPCVLVANRKDIPKDLLCNFILRPWSKVTYALREKIADRVPKAGKDNLIVTAMMLAFVAAVEQNLLGFGPVARRRAWREEPTLIPEGLADYLGGK